MIRKLTLKQFLSIQDEDVMCFEVNDGVCTVYACLEYWEDCPKEFRDDPFRINEYSGTWEIPQAHLLESIIKTAVEEAGCRSGSICFSHEEDREDGVTAIEELYSNFPGAMLLELKDENFKCLLPIMKDGIYIVHEISSSSDEAA